jgi:hypothetical protein
MSLAKQMCDGRDRRGPINLPARSGPFGEHSSHTNLENECAHCLETRKVHREAVETSGPDRWSSVQTADPALLSLFRHLGKSFLQETHHLSHTTDLMDKLFQMRGRL